MCVCGGGGGEGLWSSILFFFLLNALWAVVVECGPLWVSVNT